MQVRSCIPVIPSLDLEIHRLRARLEGLGYNVSGIEDRHHGQTEFFVTDDDGYSHCFGVATTELAP